MKRVNYIIAGILTAGLLGCGQEQSEEKKPETEEKSGLMSLFEKHKQDITVTSAPAERPNLRSEMGPRHGRAGQDRGMKERGPRGSKDRPRGLQPGQKKLSEAEIRVIREKAAQARDAQLAEARKNITSKDENLRLNAVSHLDTDNANDLGQLENVLMADPNSEIREEAALQLGDGDRKAVEPVLIKALNDPAPEVVISAIESLASMEGKNKSAIIEAIKRIGGAHSDEEVREAAQSALDDLE